MNGLKETAPSFAPVAAATLDDAMAELFLPKGELRLAEHRKARFLPMPGRRRCRVRANPLRFAAALARRASALRTRQLRPYAIAAS
jgi:hypothetical protein